MQKSRYQTKKRFGQHFLHDLNIIERIIQAVHPLSSERLIEIGPGLGALSFPLLEYVRQLDVIEIDNDVVAQLNTRIHAQNIDNLVIHHTDALKLSLADLYIDQPMRIVGNLPYNISTPIIFHLLKYHELIDEMYFMLQKEVVDRLTASPGTKDYGRLSIMAQYHCQTEYLFFVGPASFDPPPKVDSAVLRIKPHKEKPVLADNEAVFSATVAQAFTRRRKTLRNALKDLMTDDLWQKTTINPKLRPENLTVAEFVELSNLIHTP